MVTLKEAKQHLNIDYDDDDDYISDLIETAKEVIASDIGLSQDQTLDDVFAQGLPRKLSHAIKILVNTYYFNREAISTQETKPVGLGYYHLIQPYKIYT